MRLKDLPEKERELALLRQKEYQIKRKKTVREDVEDFLLTAFSWQETPEGNEYWLNFITRKP